MTILQNLDELDSYVHNCFICGKEMPITLNGIMIPEKWKIRARKHINLKLKRDGNSFASQHPEHKLVINSQNNTITVGEKFLSDMTQNNIYLNKNCTNCHLRTSSLVLVPKTKKLNRLLHLTLASEELHFTLKGNRDVRIEKYYGFGGFPENPITYFYLNNKDLPSVPFDFNKINSFEHLLKRIGTIILFH